MKAALLPAAPRGDHRRAARVARRSCQSASAAELGGYQALKKHVFEAPREVAASSGAAVDNADERRVARAARRRHGRDGLGLQPPQRRRLLHPVRLAGATLSHYFPDFIVRAQVGEVFHNFIIEVKGRLDDRDKAKARARPALLRDC